MDDELGNQLVATMLYLDSENHKDMQLYINCSGGEVCHGSARSRGRSLRADDIECPM